MMRISVATLLVLVAASLQAAPPQGSEVPAVYDAENRFIGRVLGFGGPNGTVAVVMNLNGKFVSVALDRAGFRLTGTLFYTSFDCSGPAYDYPSTSNSNNRLLFPSFVLPPGKTVYISPPDAPVTSTLTYNSYRQGAKCTIKTSTISNAIEVLRMYNLSLTFKPPFTIRTEP
jgi:hypothetical protein